MINTNIKILLVENNPADVLLIQSELNKDSLNTFEVCAVENSQAGLLQLAGATFDIILAALPAFEALHRQAPHVPVVILSDRLDELKALEAIQAGAQDYLLKDTAGYSMAARVVRHAIERQKLIRKVEESDSRYQALHQSDERYQQFISQSFEGIYLTGFDQPIDTSLPIEEQIDAIYANAYMAESNQALADMYHLPSVDVLIGVRMIDAHGGKDNPVNRATFRKFIANGYKSVNDETFEYTADGQPIWCLSNTIGTVENGKLVRMWGTSIDITERKLAEEKLRKNQQLLQESQVIANLHSWMLDLKTGMFELNTTIAPEIELPARVTNVDTLLALIHPLDRYKVKAAWQAAIPNLTTADQAYNENNAVDVEFRIMANQDVRWIHMKARLLLDENGQPAFVNGVAQDITQRKQFEELVQAQRDLARIISMFTTGQAPWPACLETVLSVSGMDCGGIYMLDQKLQRLKMVYHAGLSAEFTASVSSYELASPSARVVMNGQPIYFDRQELSVHPHHQRERMGALAVIPIHYQGQVLGSMNIGSHILDVVPPLTRQTLETLATEVGNLAIALHTQSALRESEEKYRSLVNCQEAAIATIDAEGVFHYINDIGAQELGASPEQIVGGKIHDFFPESTLMLRFNMVLQVFANGQGNVYEISEPLPTGNRWWRISAQPVRDADGRVILAMINSLDITEQKRMDEILKVEQNRFASLAATVPGAICTFRLSADGRLNIPYASAAFEDLYGLKLADLANNIDALTQRVPPEQIDLLMKAIEVSAHTLKPWHNEYLYNHPVKGMIWLEGHSTPIRETDGSIVWHGITIDVTERKRIDVELRKSEALLREAQRIGRIGHVEWVAPNATLVFSDELYNILELPRDSDPPTHATIGNLMDPADLKNLLEWQRKLLASQGDLDYEYPVYLPSGRKRWLHEQVKISYDENGRPARTMGIIQDITEQKLAEENLHASTHKFNDLFNNVPLEGIIYRLVHDEHGEIIDWEISDINPLGAQSLGKPADELIGKRASELFGMGTMSGYIDISRQVVASGQARLFETHFEGNNRSYMSSVFMVGQEHYANISVDITERKTAELTLRQSEKRFATIVQHSPLGIVISRRRDNVIIEVNLAWVNLLGYERQEIIGATALGLGIWDDPQQRADLLSGLEGGQPVHDFETILCSKNGQKRTVLMSAEIIEIENEPCLLAQIIDISARKKSEEERQKLMETLNARTKDLSLLVEAGRALGQTLNPKEIYSTIYRYASAALPCDMLIVSSFDPQTELLTCQHMESEYGAQDVSGFPPIPLEPPGRGTQSLVIRSGESLLLPDYIQAMKTAKTSYHINEKAQIVDEPPEDAETTRSAIIVPLTEEGKVAGALQIFSMVKNSHTEDHLRFLEALAFRASAALSNARLFTELENRVRARTKEIESTRQRLELATRAAGMGVWEWNMHTGQLLWDEQMYAINGISHEAFDGTMATLFKIVHPDDVARLMDSAQSAIENAVYTPIEYRILRNGGMGYIRAHGVVVNNSDHQVDQIIGVIQDITQEKLAENALRENEETYRALFENANDAIFLLDPHARVIRVNPHCGQLLGYTSTEMIGRKSSDFVLATELEDAFNRFVCILRGDTVPSYERTLVCKNGTLILSEINLSLIRDENHKPKFVQSVIRDITARKQVEETLRLANAELERAMRMKDEFLANMSHELRTPLNGILGLSEILLDGMRGPLNMYQQKYVRTIDASGRHLLSLINDLLDLSKIEAGKLELHTETVFINDVCQASLAFVKEQAIKKFIALEYLPDSRVSTISVDQLRLKQILVNLLSNAVKFTPLNGRVILQIHANAPQNCIELMVKDTGIGISQADLARLFKPFTQVDTSLTRQYDGTGLGLALVKRLAEMHNGTVTVTSQVGSGSCFTVTLPWHTIPGLEQPLDIPESHHQEEPATPGIPAAQYLGVVLLAEDNEINVVTTGDYLESIGYRIIIATNGREALEKAVQTPPDIILMDIQMPEIDGLEAIRRMRTMPQFKHTPIIALTALAMNEDRERCLAAGANEYVSKPVGLRNLSTLMSELLHKK